MTRPAVRPALMGFIFLLALLGLAGCGSEEPAETAAEPNAAASHNEDERNDAASATSAARQDSGETDELPAPIAALTRRGIEIVGRFDTPGELSGYAATFQGQPLAIYLTPDGQRAVVGGTLVDAEGNNLTANALQAAISGPQARRAWQTFEEDGDWVLDGDAEAPRVVYEITDPNCPYCARFNEAARPWVNAGAVQIRHVMVGIIRADSPDKAVAIITADDPAAALMRNFGPEEIDVPDELPEDALARVRNNNQQMQSLGYRATPTLLYRDDNGDIQSHQGMPRGPTLEAILGPRP